MTCSSMTFGNGISNVNENLHNLLYMVFVILIIFVIAMAGEASGILCLVNLYIQGHYTKKYVEK